MNQLLPSLLVSYAYLKEKHIPLLGQGFYEWVLDSGAYSALGAGKVIRNEDFIQFALNAQKRDPRLKHIFALDVIGNPEASLKNALEAKAAGLNVIPCWHAGEPLEFAQEMAKQFDKLALGGLVARLENNRAQLFDTKVKVHHAMNFFKAVWPKWVHGFGCTAEELMEQLPFASVDSTTWSLRPSMYGSWKTFGFLPLRLSKDTKDALKTEVDWFLDRESFHDAQWRRELAKVSCERFRIRFACSVSNARDVSRMFCPGEILTTEPEPSEGEENAVNQVPGTNPAPVKPPCTKKSIEIPENAYQYEDYWKKRLFHRDPRADIQK